MLQTKLKTQNSHFVRQNSARRAKLKTQDVSRFACLAGRRAYHVLPCRGFTVIEMIVTLSILALIIVIASGFLFSTISGGNKVEATKEVRQNGSLALSVMEKMILTSRLVSCPVAGNGKEILVQDQDGFSTSFVCDETGGKISSNSAVLTGSNVFVSGCSFACTSEVGRPVKVSIGFTVSQRNASGLKPSEKSSMVFQTEVVAKNF